MLTMFSYEPKKYNINPFVSQKYEEVKRTHILWKNITYFFVKKLTIDRA